MSKQDPSSPKERSSPFFLLLLAIAVPVLLVTLLVYVWEVYKPMHETQESAGATLQQMIGLSTPVIGGNKLSPEYTDADGDLVADAPTDPARQIDPPKLIFSYIAEEDSDKSLEAWKPFVEHLSTVTGKPVEIWSIRETSTQLLVVHSGELHVTGFNSGAVPTAVDAAGFVPVCLIPGSNGLGRTSSSFVVPAGSPMKSVADIRGHEITYTYPTSNSGFKAPILTLLEKFDLRPGKDYNIVYSQGHEQSIMRLAKKQCEVAAVASDMLSRATAAGEISAKDCRVLYETEQFPTASIGYAHNLKPELAAKIREAVLTFDWKGTALEKTLASSRTTFVPANYKNDFSLLRRIDDITGTKHELK